MFIMSLVNCMDIKVIIVIAVVISVFKLVCTSVIVLLSIAIDVIRFISLTILVPPGNTNVSKQTNESNSNIDKVVDKTTAREGGLKAPPSEREKNSCYSNKLK